MKLTEHFDTSEFLKGHDREPSLVELVYMKYMANTLEVVRDILCTPVKIVSGVRDFGDYLRLQKEGYNPSSTSDHFYGLPVELFDKSKVAIYGKFYTFSVGAVDLEFPGIDKEVAFDILCTYLKNNTRKGYYCLFVDNLHASYIGQMLLEKSSKCTCLHISNPCSLCYNSEFFRYGKKPKILKIIEGSDTEFPFIKQL